MNLLNSCGVLNVSCGCSTTAMIKVFLSIKQNDSTSLATGINHGTPVISSPLVQNYVSCFPRCLEDTIQHANKHKPILGPQLCSGPAWLCGHCGTELRPIFQGCGFIFWITALSSAMARNSFGC